MTIGELVAIATGAAGLLGTIVGLIYIRPQLRKLTADGNKTKADAAKVLSDTALSLLAPSEALAHKLERQLSAAEAKIGELGLNLIDANSRMAEAQSRADGLAEKLTDAERQVKALTDRLTLAQRLLTEHGVPFPPIPDR